MSLDVILTIVAVFTAVAIGAGALTWALLARTTPERRRLERASHPASASGLFVDAPTLQPDDTAFVKQMNAIVPRSKKERGVLERRMIRGGLQPTAVPIAIYSLSQVVLPILLALGAFVILPIGSAW